jgi:hypothetical protein
MRGPQRHRPPHVGNRTHAFKKLTAPNLPALVAGGQVFQPDSVGDIGAHGRQRGHGLSVIEPHQHIADIEDERFDLHRAKWS